MTTLTAVPNADGTAVVLTLEPTESIPGITRSDANGTVDVRFPAGTFPRTTPLTYTDWESSLGTVVNYSTSGAAASVMLGSESPVLVAPLRPALSEVVEMVVDYGAARASLGTIHQVADRPDPLAALGRLATRAGSLAVWVPSYAAGRAVENMIDRSGVVFYKQREHAGLDMYFVSTGTELRSDTESEGWILNVAYQEITRPTSPINEAAWTFGSVSTSFASFRNVTSGYSDFEGLSVNDQSNVI
jgi:hypothetical protein